MLKNQLICASTLFFLFISLTARSQYSTPSAPVQQTGYAQNSLYSELSGPGMALSANYDRRFNGTNGGLGFRVGLGYNFGTNPTIFTIPVGLNYLAGQHNNFFELGAGVTYMSMQDVSAANRYTIGSKTFDDPGNFIFVNSVIGYRHQPKHGGFSFRAGISPYFGEGAGVLAYLGAGCNF